MKNAAYICEYNIKTGWMLDGTGLELPYLCFMCFKKNIWMVSEVYRKDDIYAITNDIEHYNDIFLITTL